MPSDTLASSPSREQTKKHHSGGRRSAEPRSCKTMKRKFSLVQMKKTVKLLEGMGKSITQAFDLPRRQHFSPDNFGLPKRKTGRQPSQMNGIDAMVKYKRPRYLHAYRDRHGKTRIYFNKPGEAKIALQGPLYSERFWIDYRNAEAGLGRVKEGAGAAKTVPGTFNDLIARYYASASFTSKAGATRRNYKSSIEPFRREHGHKGVATLKPKHIDNILGEVAQRSTSAAHNLRKRLSEAPATRGEMGVSRLTIRCCSPTGCTTKRKAIEPGRKRTSQNSAPIGRRARGSASRWKSCSIPGFAAAMRRDLGRSTYRAIIS